MSRMFYGNASGSEFGDVHSFYNPKFNWYKKAKTEKI